MKETKSVLKNMVRPGSKDLDYEEDEVFIIFFIKLSKNFLSFNFIFKPIF